MTSSVMTLKPASVHGPNEVTIATVRTAQSWPGERGISVEKTELGNFPIKKFTVGCEEPQYSVRCCNGR